MQGVESEPPATHRIMPSSSSSFPFRASYFCSVFGFAPFISLVVFLLAFLFLFLDPFHFFFLSLLFSRGRRWTSGRARARMVSVLHAQTSYLRACLREGRFLALSPSPAVDARCLVSVLLSAHVQRRLSLCRAVAMPRCRGAFWSRWAPVPGHRRACESRPDFYLCGSWLAGIRYLGISTRASRCYIYACTDTLSTRAQILHGV